MQERLAPGTKQKFALYLMQIQAGAVRLQSASTYVVFSYHNIVFTNVVAVMVAPHALRFLSVFLSNHIFTTLFSFLGDALYYSSN